MKRGFKGVFANLVLMFGFVQFAQAWTVTAFDKVSGGSHTVWNSASPEEAEKEAMIGCRAKAKVTDCEPWKALTGTAVILASGQPKKGGGKHVSRSANQNPETAAKNALASCREEAVNCKLTLAIWDSGATWMALAMGSKSGFFFHYDALTRAEAEREAVAGCEKRTNEKGTCTVVPDFVSSKHAWFTIAGNDNFTSFGGSSKSKADSEAFAMDECRKGSTTPKTCKPYQTNENRGPIKPPASFEKIKQQVERDNSNEAPASPAGLKKLQEVNSCRPKSQTLTCSSQCTNGDCTVTYENGCKVRVQVQPRFDSLTNSWTYPAPAC